MAQIQNTEIDRTPEAVARLIRSKLPDPETRKLVTDGLVFSKANFTAQEVLEVYAPMLVEMQLDFAIRHMNDEEDYKARELSHKFSTKMADFTMKKQGIQEEDSGDTFNEDAVALNKLLEIQEALTKNGTSIQQILDADVPIKADYEVEKEG